eukprot:1918130-Rhodomonas_salina.4
MLQWQETCVLLELAAGLDHALLDDGLDLGARCHLAVEERAGEGRLHRVARVRVPEEQRQLLSGSEEEISEDECCVVMWQKISEGGCAVACVCVVCCHVAMVWAI